MCEVAAAASARALAAALAVVWEDVLAAVWEGVGGGGAVHPLA